MAHRRPAKPHPTMAAARRAVARLTEGLPDPLILAVSGGSDSMALALAAQYHARRAGKATVCVIVDHGLRPESAAEARTVAGRLEALGFDDVRIVRAQIGATGGPEGAARAARYGVLADIARETGGVLLLGHTADDQGETVLLGLARGSGPRSIAGMAEVTSLAGAPDIRVLRPLLGLRRGDLREALAEAGVEWVEDPMNHPDGPYRAADGSSLRRSAIRHEAIPALDAALGMSVVEPLARTAQLLRRDTEALDEWAEAEYVRHIHAEDEGGCEGHIVCEIAAISALPVAVRTRLLRKAALAAGAEAGALTFWHIEHMDDLVTGAGRVRGHRSVDLPASQPRTKIVVRQEAGRLIFEAVQV